MLKSSLPALTEPAGPAAQSSSAASDAFTARETEYDADAEVTRTLEAELLPSAKGAHSNDATPEHLSLTRTAKQALAATHIEGASAKKRKGQVPNGPVPKRMRQSNGPMQMTGPAVNSRSSLGPSAGSFDLPGW